MAGYFVKPPQDGVGPGNEDFAFLAETHPAVAWLLAGRPKDHPEGYMPPMNLQFFFDTGRLKACFSSRSYAFVCFLTIDDPTNPLGCVESVLQGGKIEWKKSRQFRS